MPYKLTEEENKVYEKNKYLHSNGKTECVAFVQQGATMPNTTNWRKGRKVLDANVGEIPRGTAIATFDDNGSYPIDNKGRHAAIYLSHNPSDKSIEVLDQWASQGGVKQRTIRYWGEKKDAKQGQNYRRSNDSDTFYVIE